MSTLLTSSRSRTFRSTRFSTRTTASPARTRDSSTDAGTNGAATARSSRTVRSSFESPRSIPGDCRETSRTRPSSLPIVSVSYPAVLSRPPRILRNRSSCSTRGRVFGTTSAHPALLSLSRYASNSDTTRLRASDAALPASFLEVFRCFSSRALLRFRRQRRRFCCSHFCLELQNRSCIHPHHHHHHIQRSSSSSSSSSSSPPVLPLSPSPVLLFCSRSSLPRAPKSTPARPRARRTPLSSSPLRSRKIRRRHAERANTRETNGEDDDEEDNAQGDRVRRRAHHHQCQEHRAS